MSHRDRLPLIYRWVRLYRACVPFSILLYTAVYITRLYTDCKLHCILINSNTDFVVRFFSDFLLDWSKMLSGHLHFSHVYVKTIYTIHTSTTIYEYITWKRIFSIDCWLFVVQMAKMNIDRIYTGYIQERNLN